MDELGLYNPLDYKNLTKSLVTELMRRKVALLPPPKFPGPGVYALFYLGALNFYKRFVSPDATLPIYVGKAEPAGRRKGRSSQSHGFELHSRLREHSKTVSAARNLKLSDFRCRYIAVEPLWIGMAEQFLLDQYAPLWNTSIDGFGAHDPGAGRRAGELPLWDVLHPGREWSKKHKRTRSVEQAIQLINQYRSPSAAGSETGADGD